MPLIFTYSRHAWIESGVKFSPRSKRSNISFIDIICTLSTSSFWSRRGPSYIQSKASPQHLILPVRESHQVFVFQKSLSCA